MAVEVELNTMNGAILCEALLGVRAGFVILGFEGLHPKNSNSCARRCSGSARASCLGSRVPKGCRTSALNLCEALLGALLRVRAGGLIRVSGATCF